MNCGRVFSQQFLIPHMRTEPTQEKLVSNRTDSSVSVDERQIKESRGGSKRSLPLPDLSWNIEGPLLAGYEVVCSGSKLELLCDWHYTGLKHSICKGK